MSRIVCGVCGKGMQTGRRYRLEPLAEAIGESVIRVCRIAKVSGTTEQEARCHGVLRHMADRMAVRCDIHPYLAWPEMHDHDVEEITLTCAGDDCTEQFLPSRNGHRRFCSLRCRSRAQGKRKRSKPAYRKAQARKSKAWKEANIDSHRDYQRRYQRRYMRLRRAAQREAAA